MFIKKPKPVKAYAYRMILSFKTSVTYKKKHLHAEQFVRCEAAFVGHNSIFCRTLFDV